MTDEIFLLLGSNLGDREANLDLAGHHIERLIGEIVKKSSLYKTVAWGKTDQPYFFNQVLEVRTLLSPEKLLQQILSIERSMGRARAERWGERLIDIDILLYGDTILDSDTLHIPHPHMHNRRFTLVPLAEIAPGMIHPVFKKNITTLLEECPDELGVEVVKWANGQ
jgi:2-amino-4-hydroxy-6-hydroxymethyldihydropteridine diphosphokinase